MIACDHEALQRRRDLAHLRYHWGGPYEIGWTEAVVQRDTQDVILPGIQPAVRTARKDVPVSQTSNRQVGPFLGWSASPASQCM